MSIIKCPECKGKVSSSAEICPHCGYKISNIQNVEVIAEEQKRQSKSNKTRFITILIVLVVLVIMFMAWDYSQHGYTRAMKEAEEAAEEYHRYKYDIYKEE